MSHDFLCINADKAKPMVIVYIDGHMYMKKPLEIIDDKVTIRGSYYGSSTRIGEAGEVYNKKLTPQYPDKKIVIEEVYPDKLPVLVFSGTFNVLDYCISIASLQKLIFPDIKEHESIDKQITQIYEGTYCPIDNFSPEFVLDSSINLTLRFRYLHRFGDIVEISTVSYSK